MYRKTIRASAAREAGIDIPTLCYQGYTEVQPADFACAELR